MKGTLFSADFVKDSTGNLRLLELNTDTGFIVQELNNFNFTEFKQILIDNNISELDIIYKPGIHKYFVDHISSSVSSHVSTINLHKEDNNTIYPTQVTDSDNKFILRLAYDESALFDSEYCKNRLNVFNLFTDNSINDYCVGYYHSSSLGEKNTLTKEINTNNIPDATIKDISETHNPIDFFKIGSQNENESIEDRWNNFISENVADDKLIEQYHFHSSSVDENNHITSYRFFGIVYGSNLEVVNLHSYKISSIFDLPSDLLSEVNTSQYTNKIADHHYYEYTTNFIKNDSAGILSTHEILTEDNTYKVISEIAVGDYVKSYYVSRSVEDESNLDWNFSDSTIPSGSYLTSSIVIYKKLENLKYNSMYELKVDDDSLFSGLSKSFLIFNSGSNTTSFKEISSINPAHDYLYDINGNLIDIDELNFYVSTDNDLTYIELDVEDTDTYIISGSTAFNSVVSHNAPCFVAGTQILLENGLTKNIEDVVVGDYIVSFDLKNNEPKVSKVLNTFSKTIDKIVEYEFSNGSILKATLDHPIYVNNKGWVNYSGEPEEYNNVSTEGTKPVRKLEVQKIEIGDVVKLHNGDVELVKMNVIEESTIVYNLSEIETYHNYFANNVLVHNLRPVGCFITGTEITLSNGDVKNIEDVIVGEGVLTYNEVSGEQEVGVVGNLKQHEVHSVIKLIFDNEVVITTTLEHPFFVDSKGWVKAGNLELHDVCKKVNGDTSILTSIEVLEESHVVYNLLSVSQNHNFYANGILVHNK
jgi:intein/homing endonuclease